MHAPPPGNVGIVAKSKMPSRRRKLILALAMYLENDADWRAEAEKSKKKRTHKYWVKGWISRRENDESNTIFALQKELEVSLMLPSHKETLNAV